MNVFELQQIQNSWKGNIIQQGTLIEGGLFKYLFRGADDFQSMPLKSSIQEKSFPDFCCSSDGTIVAIAQRDQIQLIDRVSNTVINFQGNEVMSS